jgi:hypothetical protein
MSEHRISRISLRSGQALSGLTAAIVMVSAAGKMAGLPKVVEGLTHAGIPRQDLVPIAGLELTCLLLYLVPRSGVLGTLMLTGYFGGAIVTHIIGHESFLPPLVVGALACIGGYLRFPELRQALPLRMLGRPDVEEHLHGSAPAGVRAR